MSNADLRGELRAMLSELAPGTRFDDSDDVFAKRIVTSVSDLLELIVQLEDRFGIKLDEDDLFDGHLCSVDRIAALVASRRKRWT